MCTGTCDCGCAFERGNPKLGNPGRVDDQFVRVGVRGDDAAVTVPVVRVFCEYMELTGRALAAAAVLPIVLWE